MPEKNIIIVAPHPDDEIIGTYHILKNYKTMIIYDPSTPQLRREESQKLRDHFDVVAQIYLATIPAPWYTIKDAVFFFPDPIYERHPMHRQWGFAGEQLARQGKDVIFYSTIMNTPYIHEVDEPENKRDLLNKIYPSQKTMWEWNHKYWLFEGYQQWIYDFERIL